MVSGKSGRPKRQKPCGRLRGAERDDVAISASGDPAMAFKSKWASILPMVRAFYPLSPSRRIAAGHAAQAFHACALIKCMILIGKPEDHFSGSCKKRAQHARVDSVNGECCASRARPCNAP